MTSIFTTTQIQSRFDELPADIQELISSDQTVQLIKDVGERHGLRIDNLSILIEYSGLVMLGLIQSDDFVSELSQQLNLSTEQAEAIVIDIDHYVFSRVRESLHSVQYQSTSDARFVIPDSDVTQQTETPIDLSDMATDDYSQTETSFSPDSEPVVDMTHEEQIELHEDGTLIERVPVPSPALHPDIITDFQARLEEQVSQTDRSAQNSDPYKESI